MIIHFKELFVSSKTFKLSLNATDINPSNIQLVKIDFLRNCVCIAEYSIEYCNIKSVLRVIKFLVLFLHLKKFKERDFIPETVAINQCHLKRAVLC